MEPKEMNQEKMESPSTPGAEKISEHGAGTTQALLGPGTPVRGLLGPGIQETEAHGGGSFPSE